MAAEEWLEVKVIFLATQPVSNDTPQPRLMGVRKVGQCRRRGAEVSGGTRKRHKNVFTHLLADELIRGKQRWHVGMAMAEQKLDLAMYQHLLTDRHAI